MNFLQYVKGNFLIADSFTTAAVNIESLVSFLQSNTYIKKLSLVNLNISNEDAKALAELKQLTSLDLSNNKVGDEGAKALAELKQLTSLDLSNNKVGDEGAKALAELKKLTSLDLSNNKVGDEGAKALAELKQLTSLDLSNNKVGDEGAKALAELKKLTSLDLSNNKVGDEGAKALAELKKLTSLDLSDNKIGDEGVKALAEFKQLTSLKLSDNKIGDEGAKALAELKQLTSLKLSNNKIGDEGVKALAESEYFPRLTGVPDLSDFFKHLMNFRRAEEIIPKKYKNNPIVQGRMVKRLLFNVVQCEHPKRKIKLYLDNSDKYPFQISSQDEKGYTLLHHAVFSRNEDLVDFLLGKRVDVDLQDNNGKTPFHYAIDLDSENIAKLFITHKVKLQGSNAQESEYLKNSDTSIKREMLEHWNKCLKEVKKMEEEKIGSGVTLYDILGSKDGKLVSYIRKVKAEDKLKYTKHDNGFSIYGSNLKHQFKIGEQRLDALKTGEIINMHFSDFNGKAGVYNWKIAEYLCNKDIKILRKAAIQIMDEKIPEFLDNVNIENLNGADINTTSHY